MQQLIFPHTIVGYSTAHKHAHSQPSLLPPIYVSIYNNMLGSVDKTISKCTRINNKYRYRKWKQYYIHIYIPKLIKCYLCISMNMHHDFLSHCFANTKLPLLLWQDIWRIPHRPVSSSRRAASPSPLSPGMPHPSRTLAVIVHTCHAHMSCHSQGHAVLLPATVTAAPLQSFVEFSPSKFNVYRTFQIWFMGDNLSFERLLFGEYVECVFSKFSF